MVLIIFIILLIVAAVVPIALAYILAPRAPSEVKERRFESGGPPFGEVRRRLVMQYFGFIFMVVALEAAASIALIYAAVSRNYVVPSIIAAAIGASAYALAKVAYRIEEWR